MKKFKVYFETFCSISIEVEADNEEEAREKASENVKIIDLAPTRGYGSTIALKGECNSLYVDKDNMYDRISEIEEI